MPPCQTRFTEYLCRLLVVGALASFSCLSIGAVDPETELRLKRDYEARLSATQSLFSALSREAGQKDVDAILGKARIQFGDAAARASERNYESATQLINQTNGELKSTLIQIKAKPGSAASPALSSNDLPNEKRERERVGKEMTSTRALIDALKREPATSSGDIKSLEKDLDAASILLDAGKTTDAATLIDATYARAKSVLGLVKTSPQYVTGSASVEAGNLARKNTVDSSELRQRYARRDETVGSLQTAFERVAQEKGVKTRLLGETGTMRTEARKSADAGQYPSAIELLDRAYLLLKAGLSELRGGAELTASKNFSSSEEEFRYEQARNDDYAQLIEGLLRRSPERNDWKGLAAHAKQLRDQAENAGRSGEWKSALSQISESTLDLKKILRSAGFPIL